MVRKNLFSGIEVIVLASILAACSGRVPPQISRNTEHPQPDYDYVDLQPGWRIKVVTPILKSGKFVTDAQVVGQKGNQMIVKVGPDFVGYELAYYAVRAHSGGGVSIRFSSAQIFRNGRPTKQSRPTVPLFDLPTNMSFIRLIFLIRVSKADHDQGILAASSLGQLEELTRDVEIDPEGNCRAFAEAVCSWIPRGIAAQPEHRNPAHRNEWLATW
jgi:hypothetical protein